MTEFSARLHKLYLAAGQPSYQRLQEYAQRLGRELPTSTTGDLLKGGRRPRWRTVETFVLACHQHARAQRVDLEEGISSLTSWQGAYNELSGTLAVRGASAGQEGHSQQERAVSQRMPMVPRQLLAAPPLFTGRTRELTDLTRALDTGAERGAMLISAIGGAGGIGKTWLALHWAHENVQLFPDGQLYVNLRGFDPSEPPIACGVAVRGFLDALGMEPRALPVDLDAQAALYRSLLDDKRMLVVLDNARDTEQVAPLLPGSPTCAVLVTSRNHLADLVIKHGARRLDLDVLSEPEARDLLARHLGPDRVAAEPAAVTELLDWCAGLPLALRIVAARATIHRDFPLAVLAEELRETSTRLDALEGDELSANLRVVFSCSYHMLNAEVAKLFELLGLVSGPDISLLAIASLTAQSTHHTRKLLRCLEAAYLVQEHVPGRYRMHDLICLYAAEQAHRNHPQGTRNAALQRLVDFYLHTARTGEQLLFPHRLPIPVDQLTPGCVPHLLKDPVTALAWFDTEHLCLLAAHRLASKQGWHSRVWQLAWALDTFHWRRGHLHDHLAVWQAGLAAADELDDLAIQTRAHRSLGHACVGVGMNAEAIAHLKQALTLAQGTGDTLDQARTHHALARAWERQGDDHQALTHARHALHFYRAAKDTAGEALALNSVGWFRAQIGLYEQARSDCSTALAMHRQHDNHVGEASTLDSLGYIAHGMGRNNDSISYYHDAATAYHDLGDSYEEANTLARLGEVHAALDHHAEARAAFRQALDLYKSQHRTTDTERIQQQLTALDTADDQSSTTPES